MYLHNGLLALHFKNLAQPTRAIRKCQIDNFTESRELHMSAHVCCGMEGEKVP
jgi:hypothetical protein